MKNRRNFFDSFAMKKGFDPLVPNNWYSVSLKAIKAHKVHYHRDFESKGLRKSLVHVYPAIGLVPAKLFPRQQSSKQFLILGYLLI